MKSFSYVVKEPEGIHARPAGVLTKACKAMAPNKVKITKGVKTADASKIFAVMGLGVKCGEEIVFSIEGPDEEAKAAELEKLVQENL